MPQRASSTAISMASRLASQPTTARRGVPRPDGATSAWISTSRGRVPSTPANTAAPGLVRSRSPKQLGRVGHLDEAGAGHLEDADLVGGAEPVLDRAQDAVGARSPSKYSTVSTMCSTTWARRSARPW